MATKMSEVLEIYMLASAQYIEGNGFSSDCDHTIGSINDIIENEDTNKLNISIEASKEHIKIKSKISFNKDKDYTTNNTLGISSKKDLNTKFQIDFTSNQKEMQFKISPFIGTKEKSKLYIGIGGSIEVHF